MSQKRTKVNIDNSNIVSNSNISNSYNQKSETNQQPDNWYSRPYGIITLGIVASLIATFIWFMVSNN